MAIDAGSNTARRAMVRAAGGGAGGLRLRPLPRRRHRRRARRAPRSSDDPVDAALLERASDDQPLDLGCALPDAIHPELAEEARSRGLAHVSATTEDLDDAVCAAEGGFRGE